MPGQSTTEVRKSEFAQLFRRTHSRAYGFAYRLTGNKADAEDITQDAYLSAWSYFERYRPTGRFEGWLFRIITNHVIDLRRRQRLLQFCSLDVLEEERAAPWDRLTKARGDPAEIVVSAIGEERIRTAVSALPARYQKALVLRVVEQCSYQEIAEAISRPVGTVRSRIHRAKRLLWAALEYECLSGNAG